MGGRGIKNLHYTKPDKQQQRHKKGQAEGGDLLTPVGCQERSEEHTSELQSQSNLVCRLLLEKKKTREHFAPPPRFPHAALEAHAARPRTARRAGMAAHMCPRPLADAADRASRPQSRTRRPLT